MAICRSGDFIWYQRRRDSLHRRVSPCPHQFKVGKRKLMSRMAICFALQGGTILLVFIVALTITDTNYGKEDTVVPPIDIVKTVGEKNAVHAGPGARLGRGGGDDEVTIAGTGQEGEMMNDQSGKKY